MFNPQGPNHRLHKPPPEDVSNSQIPTDFGHWVMHQVKVPSRGPINSFIIRLEIFSETPVLARSVLARSFLHLLSSEMHYSERKDNYQGGLIRWWLTAWHTDTQTKYLTPLAHAYAETTLGYQQVYCECLMLVVSENWWWSLCSLKESVFKSLILWFDWSTIDRSI